MLTPLWVLRGSFQDELAAAEKFVVDEDFVAFGGSRRFFETVNVLQHHLRLPLVFADV